MTGGEAPDGTVEVGATAPAPTAPVAARMLGIERRFGDTVALAGVNLELRSGEIHALLGENGAGKTSLMRILAGLDRPDRGSVEVLGVPVRRFDPGILRSVGVALVQQHFTLVPTLTASENLMLARPDGWRLDRRAGRDRLAALVERTGLTVDDDVPAGRLSVGEQQRLELLRALDADAQTLLLDEPTAVLTDDEADALLRVCRQLADEGRSLVIITHKLAEVFAGCDRVTVLREGRSVLSDGTVDDHSRADLATMMVGDTSTGTFTQRARRAPVAAARRLEVSGLRLGRLDGIDLEVGIGEVVGVAGVDGNGQSELEAALSGREPPQSGRLVIDGALVATGDPRARRAQGIAYVPSDRYRWGLLRPMDLADNLTLGRTPRWRPRMSVRWDRARPSLEEWGVRCTGPQARAATLSGGNAQKLVLARELSEDPAAVLACYPTRGLDPGAADAVATRLVAYAERGGAVLWIGAELDELLAVSDRILVLAGGRQFGPFHPPFDRGAIGLAMAGEAAHS